MVLEISDLHLSFSGPEGEKTVLAGVNLEIAPGEILGLAGESGAGKSMLTLAIMGLLPSGAVITRGKIRFLGEDLLTDRNRQASFRGRKIGMVFQDPSASLDPLYRAGSQVAEIMENDERRTRLARTAELFERVELPNPKQMLYRYPHQLSGGEKQRVMIAVALAGNPALLLADEPTASLDVRTGNQIIGLLSEIRAKTGVAILFISHNLSLTARAADKLAVMYAGRILEYGPAGQVAGHPYHPYTRLLYASLPNPARRGIPLATVPGKPTAAGADTAGCIFRNRCPIARDQCREKEPALTEIYAGHRVACFPANSDEN